MNTRKTSYPPINIGTSFMLIIFIILCMVVFAVLSLSSGLKDYNYSQKNAQRTSAYYEASNQAEEILAQMDEILRQDSSLEEKKALLDNQLGDLTDGVEIEVIEKPYSDPEMIGLDREDMVPGAVLEPVLLISYDVTMGDTDCLHVQVSTVPCEGANYTILEWRQQSVVEWSGEQTLPVLGA